MNRVAITGRLKKDPKSHFTAKGSKVYGFSVAIDRRQRSIAGEKMKETD